jgi:hypothetical protein
MYQLFIILFFLFHHALACMPTDVQYVNFTSKVVNVEPANAVIKHQVGGSVKIISGCSFFIRNLTIIPTGNGAYWWAQPKNKSTEPYPRVVAAALGSYNGQSATFQLDPQYSFSDFSILEIRSEGDNRAYGAFALNGKVEDFYDVNKGRTMDFDPTKPFNSCHKVLVVKGWFLFSISSILWSLL